VNSFPNSPPRASSTWQAADPTTGNHGKRAGRARSKHKFLRQPAVLVPATCRRQCSTWLSYFETGKSAASSPARIAGQIFRRPSPARRVPKESPFTDLDTLWTAVIGEDAGRGTCLHARRAWYLSSPNKNTSPAPQAAAGRQRFAAAVAAMDSDLALAPFQIGVQTEPREAELRRHHRQLPF